MIIQMISIVLAEDDLLLLSGQSPQVGVGWMVDKAPKHILRPVGFFQRSPDHIDCPLKLQSDHRHRDNFTQLQGPFSGQRGNKGDAKPCFYRAHNRFSVTQFEVDAQIIQ